MFNLCWSKIYKNSAKKHVFLSNPYIVYEQSVYSNVRVDKWCMKAQEAILSNIFRSKYVFISFDHQVKINSLRNLFFSLNLKKNVLTEFSSFFFQFHNVRRTVFGMY